MKKYIIMVLSIISFSFCSFPINVSWAAEPLDENIFQWVQSTPRASYFFNKDAMAFEIGPDGFVNTDILLVPTVKTFDNMQIQDVIMKRQWRDLSTYRFNELVGVAEYLRINLKEHTVEFTNCTYLDQGYNTLYVDYTRATENIDTMSPKDVEYNFYQAILAYEQEHYKDLLMKDIDKVRPEQLKAAGIKIEKDKDSKHKNDSKKHKRNR